MKPYIGFITQNQFGMFVCRIYTQYNINDKKKYFGQKEFKTYEEATLWHDAYCDEDLNFVDGSEEFKKDLK